MNGSPPLNGRALSRLQTARENGYLNAACDRALARFHSQWCWRLKIPVIWMERCSPHSRYGRVHLDLFTTPDALTDAGRDALNALTERLAIAGNVTVSAHDACWERVPIRQMEDLARAVFRAAKRPGNYRLDLPQPSATSLRGPGVLMQFPERATA